jgi:hypothetical protein
MIWQFTGTRSTHPQDESGTPLTANETPAAFTNEGGGRYLTTLYPLSLRGLKSSVESVTQVFRPTRFYWRRRAVR